MKILFVGLGSAGQRHMRNIKRLYGDNVELLAYREKGLQRVFNDDLKIVEGKSLEKEYQINAFYNFEESLNEKPDVVFITNQNSRHMEFALKTAKAGIDMFIEKPIAVSMNDMTNLQNLVVEKKLIAYVGYQNRFHPCIQRAKRLVDSMEIGRICMVNSEIGEYLPKMHPWEHYPDMHESQKKLGGGVVLCQIHEEDYLYYLFGMPKEIYSVGGKRSNLEIDVEDTATSICRYETDGKEFAVVLHQDFLQSPAVRRCKIVGENGTMEFDLIGNTYQIYKNGILEENTFSNFKRNDMFIEEMESFFYSVRTREKPFVDIGEGCKLSLIHI